MTLSESCNILEWQGPIEWGAPERRVLARETRTIDVRTTEESNILDIRSRLEPTQWDIIIGPTRHAYFTVRMADGLRVVDGGKHRGRRRPQLGSGDQCQGDFRMGRQCLRRARTDAKWG